MNRNQLKLLAIFAMLCDHIAFAFVPEGSAAYFALRCFGRLAAPIMAFFIAEGYRHTRSLRRYAGRLLCAALISQPLYSLFITGGETVFAPVGNILFTLLLALGAVHVQKTRRSALWLALCVLCSLFCDWSCFPLLFALVFSSTPEKKRQTWLLYCLVCAAYVALYCDGALGLYRLGVFAAAPLLLAAYHGGSGKKTVCSKWGFYLFYPAHLLAILALKTL